MRKKRWKYCDRAESDSEICFWAALSSGSLLVVGLTELLGGTTRGYRLFMAGLLAVFAGILLASELGLTPGTVADATAGARRLLVWAFAALAAAYLLAGALQFAIVTVRAQALAPDGGMVDDFHIQEGPSSLHVLNAPSPAATASLAIAEMLADRTDAAFALGR